jgi:hypothetical protein
VCVCVCACVRACVCVCDREREREREITTASQPDEASEIVVSEVSRPPLKQPLDSSL